MNTGLWPCSTEHETLTGNILLQTTNMAMNMAVFKGAWPAKDSDSLCKAWTLASGHVERSMQHWQVTYYYRPWPWPWTWLSSMERDPQVLLMIHPLSYTIAFCPCSRKHNLQVLDYLVSHKHYLLAVFNGAWPTDSPCKPCTLLLSVLNGAQLTLPCSKSGSSPSARVQRGMTHSQCTPWTSLNFLLLFCVQMSMTRWLTL